MVAFLAPLVPAAGAALMTAGRWALMRAAPSALRAGTSLFSKKLTVGSAAALATAPTLVSMLDNSTGNALSESLLNTPVAPAIEKLLEVNEFSNNQKASVVTNLIDNGLENRGHLNESDPDYERSKRMTEALGHLIVGDTVGSASIASDLGIQQSDLIESYNQAKAANPDGTIEDIGTASFVNLREEMRQGDLQKEASVAAPAVKENNGSQRTGLSGKDFSLDGMSNEGISAVFEAATDKAGFMGFVYKAISSIAGMFGDSAQAGAQKIMLGMVDMETKTAALQKASENGMLESRLGDRFGMQNHDVGFMPELAT